MIRAPLLVKIAWSHCAGMIAANHDDKTNGMINVDLTIYDSLSPAIEG
jgi:hypothetical protein